jgi:hypothetical protein
MIRLSTEYDPDGLLVRTLDDNEDGTGTVTNYTDGISTSTETVVMSVPAQEPLDHAGSLAALLACLSVIPVEDAANAVGVTSDALEAEVLAWEMAAALP